jgi:aminoglycoside 3-N-acetyltransferase
MVITRATLIEDLGRLGLSSGGIVMIHASVRSVGPVTGGPDEIHLAVTDSVAPGGAAMMYVGCQAGFDEVGRGTLTPQEEQLVLAHQSAFDFQNARAARDFGALAGFFRSYPGTICSRHVCARMAARGDRAPWLVADHPWLYGFGEASPLDKLCVAGGKVLLIGSSHDEVTLMHYAEHLAPGRDKPVVRYKVPLMVEGERRWVDCEEFDTSKVHPAWPDDAFAQIVDDFIANASGTAACRSGLVGRAPSVLMDAAALVEHAVPIMTAWSNGGTTLMSIQR